MPFMISYKMKLTTEKLRPYVGGQLEVQNTGEGYMYRGEISSASVEDEDFVARLAWMAKLEGFPVLTGRWINEKNLDYSINLGMCSVSDIGNNRLCIQCPITGELSVLFPKGGSRLDPSKVEGLVLKATA
jgi:hypothetical protein